MKLIINSKKYGKRTVTIDDKDYDLVKNHVWRLLHQPGSQTEYAMTNIKKTPPVVTIRMHVLIMGKKDGYNIDHIDGNGLNNTRGNLRYGTQQQNTCNSRMQYNNTSGYKGVFLQKSKWDIKNPYWCYIWANKKRISGGYFKTAKEAAIRYNELAMIHHGEFAKLNKT